MFLYRTAYRALFDKLRVQSDDILLIVGASGGVGSMAIQLAKLLQVKHIIGVCSTKNIPYIKELGAHYAVDYAQESITAGVQRVVSEIYKSIDYTDYNTNEECLVDKILDCIGVVTATESTHLLAYDGVICPIVSVAEIDKAVNPFGRSLGFEQLALGAVHQAKGYSGVKHREHMMTIGHKVTQHVINNELQLPILKVIPLELLSVHLIEMLNANTTGKIVLKF